VFPYIFELRMLPGGEPHFTPDVYDECGWGPAAPSEWAPSIITRGGVTGSQTSKPGRPNPDSYFRKSPHTHALPPGPPDQTMLHQLSPLQPEPSWTVWPSPPSSMPMTLPTPPGTS
jgi:hypothetical protein